MVVFRQRRVFVCVSGLVLAAAVLYAMVGAKYQANMKVLVRRGRADAPVSAGQNAPLDMTRVAVTEEELNSEVELLQRRRRLAKSRGNNRRWWARLAALSAPQGGTGRAQGADGARAGEELESRAGEEDEPDCHQLCGERSADGG